MYKLYSSTKLEDIAELFVQSKIPKTTIQVAKAYELPEVLFSILSPFSSHVCMIEHAIETNAVKTTRLKTLTVSLNLKFQNMTPHRTLKIVSSMEWLVCMLKAERNSGEVERRQGCS